MRLGIQHDLAETIAGRWVAAIRRDLPTTEIYMEADYSNQMNRDLAAGELDLAVLYTPHFLPDLHYERIGELHYVLVSTDARDMLSEGDYKRVRHFRALHERCTRIGRVTHRISPEALQVRRLTMRALWIVLLGRIDVLFRRRDFQARGRRP